MPTSLERTNITHTPQVRHLLDLANVQWPDQTARVLMLNLMEAGAQALVSANPDAEQPAYERALARLAEQIDADYGNQYTDTYLDEVRAGWE
ncbi:MAG: hypothetical protein FWD75_04875 [Propionibacteriaceae bacterium]|nr:hypothetical protein [Propionibacteriaceae bacterium]